MSTSTPGSRRPLGRGPECDRLDELVAVVRNGRSGALVVRGEAGIGKTVLLDHVVQGIADSVRVLRASGVESEMELPFAGLHQLLLPILGRIQLLPDPQRNAIEVAFGLRGGDPADRLLVALAGLNLLSGAAGEHPVFCVVDDAHWLDQASLHTLLFIARRLLAEPVGLLLAVRGDGGAFAGLPELEVAGLRDRDALELLGSVVPGRLDPRMSRRILAETHGNPLAITQLPRGLDHAELSAGLGPTANMPLSGRIEAAFRRRYELLPPPARHVLLLAAAEPLGNPALLRRATALAGLPERLLVEADTGGLMVVGLHVQFEHPLARSAVYGAATGEERQAAHRAIAQAIDPHVDPDHRAWHRSRAETGPDEQIAEELEGASARAFTRGGIAASAAILERAALFSTTRMETVRRGVAAARATYEAGSPDRALELLAVLEAGHLEPQERATITRLHGQLSVSLGRPHDAVTALLDAAGELAAADPASARETYFEALEAAMYAGRRFGPMGGLSAVAEHVIRHVPDPPDEPGVVDHLLHGMLSWVTGGLPSAIPQMRRALTELSSASVDPVAVARWTWLAYHIAMSTWDDDRWSGLTERYLASVRATGALSLLPSALLGSAGFAVLTGDFGVAEALVDDARTISAAIGLPPTAAVVSSSIAAWRGERAATEAAVARVALDGSANGVHDPTLANYCLAVLNNGLGDYAAALAASRRSAYAEQLGLPVLLLPELVEAASRVGDRSEAERALERLTADTTAAGTPWALGIAAYCQALLAEGDAADMLYRRAIGFLDASRFAPFRYRARLVYGEWLRRQRRRVEARDYLEKAYEAFTGMGAHGFAERARRELLATGGTAPRRTEESRDELTPQESQVVRLAAANASNQEIATQLFISPSTVGYHLAKAFRKLDINSRRQLSTALASRDDREPHRPPRLEPRSTGRGPAT